MNDKETTTDEQDKHAHAKANARAWMANIIEMVEKLKASKDNHDSEAVDEIRQEIDEAPLSVSVRDGWYVAGSSERGEPDEFEILLSTGGPALRIYGELGEYCEPDDYPRLQWQDWFTPWDDCELTSDETEALATFARCFWFGE